jgi:hypothetical protein
MKEVLWVFVLIALVTVILAGPSLAAADNSQKEVMIQKYPENFTCFLIKAPSGIKIITDPFCMDEKIQPDIVTESHDHGDHSDVSMLIPPYKLFNRPGEFIEKGVKITGIAGRHNRGDSGITNVMYVFDIDGIRIAEFGSQGDMPSPADLKKMGTVDVLMIQLYSVTNDKLTLNESLSIVKTLGVKIIIPAHCDTAPATHTRFAKSLGGNDVTYIKSGQLAISRTELDKIKVPKVVVLDR